MAKPILWERVPNQVAWSSSGTISQELSPKPYTITRMAILVRAIGTTTTAGSYNDAWERLISRLNLTGAGKTFFDYSQMRLLYHQTRFLGYAPRRPDRIADSITTGDQHFMYIIHFGAFPTLNGRDNPFDLSGGIPPVSTGNLTLGGTFGVNTDPGSGWTTTDGDLDIYLCGVRPEAGDPVEAYMPRAFPVWSMQSPSLAATSSAFATEHNIPAGDFLRSLLVLLTNGTNNPRDDSVLNSFEVYNQLDATSVVRFGGQTGAVTDYQAAEMLLQYDPSHIVPPSDNITTAMDAIASGGTNGTLVIGGPTKDSGLLPVDFTKIAYRSPLGALYGVDMRSVATGDLKLRFGVSDATGVAMHVGYQRYQLNPAHPANVGI